MTVTLDKPVFLASGDVRITWTTTLGADATFWVYQDGLLVGITHLREWVFTLPVAGTVSAAERTTIQVKDEPAGADSLTYPARAMLLWWPQDATREYLVEEDVGGWVERATVKDAGQGVLWWESRILEDDQEHDFRVTPIGTDSNTGTALEFTVHMVRHPNGPAAAFAYSNSTGKVTISAAA